MLLFNQGELLQPPHTFLPVISDQTSQILLEELGLDKDTKTRQIVSDISGERGIHPIIAIEDWTMSVFSSLADYNKPFVEIVSLVLEKRYVNIHGRVMSGCVDAASKGMAIVLQSYHIETGRDLFSRFQSLSEEDLSEVGKILEESILPTSQAVSLLRRVLNTPKISEQHVNLISCVNKTAEEAIITGKIQFKEGAMTMFRVLSHLWPKLYPNPPR